MYLPKIKIKKPDTKVINDMIDDNGNPFVGEFFETFKGQFFSGTGPSPNSKPLIFNDSMETNFPTEGESIFKTEFIPPTKKELSNGTFKRYFLQDRRNKNIVEINKSKFDNLEDNTYSKKISIDWNLKAPAKDVYFDGVKFEGSESKNKKIVIEASKTLEGLQDYIKDYAQYIPASNINFNRFNPPPKGINTFDLPSPSSTTVVKKAKTNQDDTPNLLRENLFANPGEFIIKETGEKYVGPYHEHPEKGPMVGAKHIRAKHASLQRVKDINQIQEQQAENITSTVRQQRRNIAQQSNTSPAPSPSPAPAASPSSGGSSSSSGGYSGY